MKKPSMITTRNICQREAQHNVSALHRPPAVYSTIFNSNHSLFINLQLIFQPTKAEKVRVYRSLPVPGFQLGTIMLSVIDVRPWAHIQSLLNYSRDAKKNFMFIQSHYCKVVLV